MEKEMVMEKLLYIDQDTPSNEKVLLVAEIVALLRGDSVVDDVNFLHILGNRIYIFDLTGEQKEFFVKFFRQQLEQALAVVHKMADYHYTETDDEHAKAEKYLHSLSRKEYEELQKSYMASNNLADAKLTGLGHLNDLEPFFLLAQYPKAMKVLNDHGISMAIRALGALSREKQKDLLMAGLEFVGEEFLARETARVLFQVLYKSDKFLPELVRLLAGGKTMGIEELLNEMRSLDDEPIGDCRKGEIAVIIGKTDNLANVAPFIEFLIKGEPNKSQFRQGMEIALHRLLKLFSREQKVCFLIKVFSALNDRDLEELVSEAVSALMTGRQVPLHTENFKGEAFRQECQRLIQENEDKRKALGAVLAVLLEEQENG